MDKISAQRLGQTFIMPAMAIVVYQMHDDLLKSTGIELRVTQGWRSYADEDKLYDQGRFGNPGPIVTEVRGGYSMHNFGLAVDLCPDKVNGVPWTPDWDAKDEHYAKMIAFGERYGFNCGADWHGFIDVPHFQWKPIPTEPINAMREDFASGGLPLVWSNTLAGKYQEA